MSAKWRALQHRHRYTYASTSFPDAFLSSLRLLSPFLPASSPFLAAISSLPSLPTSFLQIPAATALASSLPSLPPSATPAAVALYLRILFLPNSLPLHRSLLSGIAKAPPAFRPLIHDALLSLFSDHSRPPAVRFAASRAALSLLSHPRLAFLDPTLADCACFVAADVVLGLSGVISAGSTLSPAAMEHCQEALSCSYYLLQRFPARFTKKVGGWSTFQSLTSVIVEILQSPAFFSRDCLVAAGVSFWAALSACCSPEQLSCFISRDFFTFHNDGTLVESASTWMELCGRDLCLDVGSLSTLSRLCLIRGMLTTVPRPLLNAQHHGSGEEPPWTILYDGVLLELCGFCENPVDRHLNFHALTVMQICFQQIKTSMLSGVVDRSQGYDPVPEDVSNRILKIVWNNLEDPLSQTVKQVHLIFDLYLDIQITFFSGEESEKTKMFLHRIASNLLCLGPRCKGRYVPLASLVRRFGAMKLLDMNPKLLFDTVDAYVDDDVCCAATTFLKCFLELLRDECWSNSGIENGYKIYRGFCLQPLLQGLVYGESKLRSSLNTYALPVLLEVDVDGIFPMLAFISVGPKEEVKALSTDVTVGRCVAALVSLLKVSRLVALVEGDVDWDNDCSDRNDFDNGSAVVAVKNINVTFPVKWLVLALTHADEHIRIDAAEFLFLNPKTSSLPSLLELQLMRKAIPLNMRCSSTAFQMKWTSLFRKFFSRVKTALERQVKQGNWQQKKCTERSQVDKAGDLMSAAFQRASELFSFTKWLSSHLFFSCYPSAPYERKTMAMALMLILLDVWPVKPPVKEGKSIYPYNEGFVSADSTLLLVGSIIDSWDRLRESSYSILSRFPTPLPGISSYDSVNEVIAWTKKLVCSPRVRESDAGALALRLIFKKYVVELGWIVRVSVNITCCNPQDKLQNGKFPSVESVVPVVAYLSSLIEWLGFAVGEGENDLSTACKHSFVHGILLALRYTFEELDWNSLAISSNACEMKSVLEKLLNLITRITSLALWVVSADAWYLPTDDNDAIEDVDVLGTAGNLDASDTLAIVNRDEEPADEVGPASQVVMVGCWLAMKEVSLLLGTIVRKIPLPGCSSCTDEIHDSANENGNLHGMSVLDAILDVKQLESIGNHFLQVLLKMKHNGAIDKTRAGFTALCNRLLSSNDPRLCHMVEAWLEQLMERTIARGQTVDDLLRRSAGIPAAFIALFLAEPEGAPKKLLPQALRWLIDVVNTSLPNSRTYYLTKDEMFPEASPETVNKDTEKPSFTSDGYIGISKTRDEGVVPTVHSFNVLRAAFNDTNLAVDTSGFAAEALITAIRSFSSSYWEVRNSACLAYTALVRRMIGFLNVHKRESARRALTGVEFFHRYRPLFPFLCDELKIATESLSDNACEYRGPDMAKAIHPSLCPILILLSRLKPSLGSSDPNDAYDPFLLLPFISRCAIQNNLRVRVLASRALTGLVSNERLQNVLFTIVAALPHQRSHMVGSIDAAHRSFSFTNGSSQSAPALNSLTYNAIHGILLQLNTLVDLNLRHLTDNSKKDDIFTEFIPMLMECSWIGNIQLCQCPTLNTSFLCILDHMLDIARSCKMEMNALYIQNLLEELSSRFLETNGPSGLTMFDPTTVELKKQATSSYFSCLFGGNLSPTLSKFPNTESTSRQIYGMNQMINVCLLDSTYEVRLATLKQIMKFLKVMDHVDAKSSIYLWVKCNLQMRMIHMLHMEDNFKCIYYILRIISIWNLFWSDKHDDCHSKDIVYLGTINFGSVFDFWTKLIHLSNTTTHNKTHEALLSCMAICTRQFVLFLHNSRFMSLSQVEGSSLDVSVNTMYQNIDKIFGCMDVFISLVKRYGASSQPVSMRRAAAESIVSSGLLKEVDFLSLHVSNCKLWSDLEEHSETKGIEPHLFHPSRIVNMYASKVLQVWSACIHMLEDEDVVLRQKLSLDVLGCITLSSQNGCFEVVPAQVESVIESCFEFLSLAFGHWIGYLSYLSQWCLEMTHHSISRKDLVRQVFDKEIDNYHEEKLLICQICCLHLKNLISSSSWTTKVNSSGIGTNNIMLFIQEWGSKFSEQIIDIGSEYLKAGGEADWIGGMGNHKDVFVAIYGNLLGLYSLLQFESGDVLLSGACDLDRHFSLCFDNMEVAIQPFLQNPLIFTLYNLLIQSQGKMSVNSADDLLSSKQCSDWEDFDPFFLLH